MKSRSKVPTKRPRRRSQKHHAAVAAAQLAMKLPDATAVRKSPAVRGPIILRHLAPAKVSEVYDSYWRFAAERQAVFFRRARGEARPWTNNPVLAVYKFTNVYRASDRVSQYLIRHVIYGDGLPKSTCEVFFRILLFKLFNKIETWELLERTLGAITFEDFRFAAYDAVLTRAMQAGRRIYSAAYIMPPGGACLRATCQASEPPVVARTHDVGSACRQVGGDAFDAGSIRNAPRLSDAR